VRDCKVQLRFSVVADPPNVCVPCSLPRLEPMKTEVTAHHHSHVDHPGVSFRVYQKQDPPNTSIIRCWQTLNAPPLLWKLCLLSLRTCVISLRQTIELLG
jgi:hypothetical protein